MKKLSMIIAVTCMMFSPMIQLHAQGVAEDDVLGVWINEDNDTLEIYKVGDKFLAKIVRLKEPIDPATGVPKLDKNNPDPILRTRPLLGLTFLTDCVFDNNKWVDGDIYNHEDGRTRHCKMKFTDESNLDRLRIQSYRVLPVFGRTTYWTKKKN